MSKLKRLPSVVLNQLVTTPTGQVLTKVPCKIQIPVRYTTRGLGNVGSTNYAYGLFPIILETGEYTVLNVCAYVELEPYKTIQISIGEVDYYELYFEANSVIIKTTDIVKRSDIMFNVFDEFIFKGKLPWYAEYEDICKIFDTAKSHADSKVASNPEVIELIASMITRSKEDRTVYIRSVANSLSDVTLDKIDFVPLNSIFYSVNSTLNKIAGSYFDDGVRSALVSETTGVSRVESILRA